MGTYRSTNANLVIPTARLASLLTAVDDFLATSGYVWPSGDADRHVDEATLADLLLEHLGSRVDDCDELDESSWTAIAEGDGSKTLTFGFHDGGCHRDRLGELLAILAAHGVTGTLEHNEDDRDFYRHRLAAGTVHLEDRLDHFYAGDIVLWVGQMQHHDDMADDVIVHAHSEDLAVAALATEARTRLHDLAADGVIQTGLIVDGTNDADVLAVWEKVIAGSPHTVRPITY